MTIILQVQSFHVLQQVIGGVDVEVGQHKALNVGLASSWIASPWPLPG